MAQTKNTSARTFNPMLDTPLTLRVLLHALTPLAIQDHDAGSTDLDALTASSLITALISGVVAGANDHPAGTLDGVGRPACPPADAASQASAIVAPPAPTATAPAAVTVVAAPAVVSAAPAIVEAPAAAPTTSHAITAVPAVVAAPPAVTTTTLAMTTAPDVVAAPDLAVTAAPAVIAASVAATAAPAVVDAPAAVTATPTTVAAPVSVTASPTNPAIAPTPAPPTLPAIPVYNGPVGNLMASNGIEYFICEAVPGSRYYSVTQGFRLGVFRGWPATSPYVTGATGFRVEKFSNRDAAIFCFLQSLTSGRVAIV